MQGVLEVLPVVEWPAVTLLNCYLLFDCPMLVIKLLVPVYLMAIGLVVLLEVQLVL